MNAKITDLAAWRATHARSINDVCRWSEAVETVTRANMQAWMTVTFLWPRILLRSAFGV
ncbi:MAG: hypothetical protein AB7S63_15215 [Thauera sp.]